MANDDTEFITIPVPRKYVSQVYAFIGSLDSKSSADEASAAFDPNADPAATDKTRKPWTAGDRELIIRQFRESPPSMKKFQLYLAENAGQDFSSTEIAEAIGAEHGWNSIAGALGAYGRRVKNRYKRRSFPFQQEWDHQHGEMRHSMTPEVAEIIRELS